MTNKSQINIAVLGLGVIGSGVVHALLGKRADYEQLVGLPLCLRHVLVQDLSKERSVDIDNDVLTDNIDDILNDDSLDIVIEVMGGEDPAYDYISRSLSSGRYVITANKMVMATHGANLRSIASNNGVDILYEASVGGGIPVISPLKRDLSSNRIQGITAIINGTTNYILTKMQEDGVAFDLALSEAQELGYAESDPSLDIDGHDAVYKIAILASLAFHTDISPDQVHCEGIEGISQRDFQHASELGYVIKLLASARMKDGSLQVRVHPALLSKDKQLAKVNGVLNAVQVEADLVGEVVFQGAGAGSLPTTSAVIADVIDASKMILRGSSTQSSDYSADISLQPIVDLVSRYYIRMEVTDRPGVFAEIARCFGDGNVSIASAIQQEVNPNVHTAEIVIMTHPAIERDVKSSISHVESLDVVAEIGSFLRVEF